MTSEELGVLADAYWDVYHKRLEADKWAKELKLREDKAKAKLIEEMRLNKLTAIGGQDVRLGLESEVVPVVEDWNKLYEHIKQNDAFDLLEKRIGKLAAKARWDADVQVPGVGKLRVYKLSKSEVKED